MQPHDNGGGHMLLPFPHPDGKYPFGSACDFDTGVGELENGSCKDIGSNFQQSAVTSNISLGTIWSLKNEDGDVVV